VDPSTARTMSTKARATASLAFAQQRIDPYGIVIGEQYVLFGMNRLVDEEEQIFCFGGAQKR